MNRSRGFYLGSIGLTVMASMTVIATMASAGVIQAPNPGAVNADDLVDWSVVGGAVGANHGSSFTVTSTNGLHVALTEAGTFATIQQAPQGAWVGGFPAGTIIESTQFGAPMSIVFSNPVYGFGLTLDDAFQSSFTGTIQALGLSFSPIGTFNVTQSGVMFLGVTDDTAEIRGITISTSDNYFAFGNLIIQDGLAAPAASTPEPSTIGLAVVGFAAILVARRRGVR
jgi:PEP-CTERM motif